MDGLGKEHDQSKGGMCCRRCMRKGSDNRSGAKLKHIDIKFDQTHRPTQELDEMPIQKSGYRILT